MCLFLAIKNALKQENLNPEIEEKLLQLQRYQERQMREGKDPTITTTINSGGSGASNSQITSSLNTISNVSSSRVPSRKRPASSIANTSSTKDQEGNEPISPPGSSNRRKLLRIENKELKSVYDTDYSSITTISLSN